MRALTILALFATAAVFGHATATTETTTTITTSDGVPKNVSYDARMHVATGKFPFAKNHPFLKVATDDNFRSLVVETTMPVLINFYKKDDRLSQTVAKAFEQSALALRPFIDVVVMDGEIQGAKDLLATYGIENLPVILQFNSDLHPVTQAPGQWAKLPDGYQGDATAGSLVRWSLGKLGHTTVERVTDDHTLSYFLSVHDHLAYPKVLLVTNTTDGGITPPMFLSMAQRMRKAAVFGVAHNTETVIKRYGITSFPTVLGFIPEGSTFGEFTMTKMPPFPSDQMIADETARLEGLKASGGLEPKEETEEEKAKKKEAERQERRNERLRKRGEATEEASKDSTADANTPNLLYGDVEYEQAQADYQHFEDWINTFAIPEEKRHQYGMLVAVEEDKARERAAEMAKWATATEPEVLKSKEDWMKHCLKLKNKGVCVVVFRDVEDFSGTKEANARLNLDLFQNISRRAAMRSQTPLQICLADGTTNYKLINALGITNGVPDMVAIWPAKNKFFNFLGAINERNLLNLFLEKALKDKGGKKLPADLPPFLKTGQSEDDANSERIKEPVMSNDDDEISDEM